MRRGIMPCMGMLLAEGLACWATWRWYAGRVAAAPEELWTLAALVTALILAGAAPAPARRPRAAWLLPALLLLAYAAGYHLLFPLARAALALAAIAATLSVWRYGTRLHAGVSGLMLLALPVMPSLQFYLGYPLRAAVAGVAALLLRLAGLAVHPDGAALQWGGTQVVVDAPCSGVKMLWTGCYLACTLACAFGFGGRATALALGGTLLLVLLGNAVRATALFLPEAGLVSLPAWGHDGVGVLVFGMTAVAIAALLHVLQRRRICAA